MAERKFSEYIKARSALKEKLEKAGITEDEYVDLHNQLGIVTNMFPEDARADQFHDDAYELAIDIQAATDKKTRQIAAFLRRFAEHVVRHSCNVEETGKIHDIVDQLPQMSDEESDESA